MGANKDNFLHLIIVDKPKRFYYDIGEAFSCHKKIFSIKDSDIFHNFAYKLSEYSILCPTIFYTAMTGSPNSCTPTNTGFLSAGRKKDTHIILWDTKQLQHFYNILKIRNREVALSLCTDSHLQ